MKNARILAAAASTLAAVGLMTACGTSTPSAQPDQFPREKQCQDIQRPSDPHNLIGSHWFNDDACNILNSNRPGAGVDADQARAIVYDARMKLMMGKRDIYALVVFLANDQLDHGVTTDFSGLIAARHATITEELDASRAALAGHAPEGYHLDFMKNDAPSASPGLTPKK
ncbi:hypothetical protein [Mycobacteroides abscessus]|uniref:hypothetical protein n=1 Tax=Mycobacteroides abscessus TaxID=36809 RepID=UPI0009272596|nr:hypothetical protein [Mycobacteroides abscessus]SHT49128.1 Uncharacterised protein [Mycobacteroides abscessus subsp. abscessus]SHT53673.1 Uncharacterised protein [Mycobacteroides abscessus subsp. abscessus]SKK64070.1 Uncharacterised protein [Mycobacteroides abscessus subsp. abscessus]